MIDITVQTPKIDIENPNRGEPGRDGIGIHYMGEINEYNDLPLTAEEGDAYYWAGKLYIFKDDEFPAENKGIQYQGPQGPEGPQGPPGKQGIQGQQGIQGEAFAISKVYKSVSEMNADFENAEVKEGQFVLINTGNIEDEDNAKLFVKGVTSYNYLTDLSGATGMTGPQGPEGPQGPPGEIAGLSGIATTEEAIAGVVDNKAMTPLKTKEAIEQGTNVFTALNTFRANIRVSNGSAAGSSGSVSFGVSPTNETVQARIGTDNYGGLFYHASTNQPHVFRNGSNLKSLVIRANDTNMNLSSGGTMFATINYVGGVQWLGNANTASKLETARTINGVAFDGTKDITISNVAPLPTNTDGVGKWTVVSTTLPNGGMWAYFGFYTDSGGGVNGNAHYAGIAAGGTTVSSGSWRHTFCWRIS